MACVALFGNSFAQTIKLDVSDSAHALPASTLARVIRNLSSTPYYQHQFADRLERKVKESALFELLLACPNSISPNFDKSEALPASIRRAIEYIHANLENFPTVVDIATAACISVRAVTKGFNKHLGTSPLQYMLDQRLEGARRQLSKGASDQKVTDVALQWGFLHLGQFSIRYKKQFGESPRETLSKAKL
jgi:transcriptional regulator GlxA family with amidase domain